MKAVYEPQNKEALQQNGITPTTFHELTSDGAQRFHDAINAAKQGPFAAAVTVKDVADYKSERLFLSEDSKSGFALAGDDLVSLFKHPSSDAKRIADSSLALGVQQGGRRLDCYDTALPRLYADNGFKAVARLPWNDEYKPSDWNYKTFDRYNKGRPDVVFMVHDPAAKPYRKGEGRRVDDYDAGIAEQKKWLGNKKYDDMLGRFFSRKYYGENPDERHPEGSGEQGGRFAPRQGGAAGAAAPSAGRADRAAAARQLSGAAIMRANTGIKPNSKKVEQVAKEMNERTGDILQSQFGKRSLEGPSPESDEFLADAIANDLKDGLQNGHASPTWYSDKMKEAMDIATTMHPELGTDKNAYFAYTTALAITSQGEVVTSSARLTEAAYAEFAKSGRFPENLRVADPAITGNFKKVNAMIEERGIDAVREFFDKEMTNKELQTLTGYKVPKTNINDTVNGSAILGPKIGMGFYQNLNGNYKPLTMDIWFMRAWGRMTNTGIGETDMGPVRSRLSEAMRQAGEKVPRNDADLLARANAITTQHERDYKTYRSEYDSGARKKSELVYAAERFKYNYGGAMVDAPKGGGQRKWINDVFNMAIAKLAKDGIKLEPAAAQATWWHPEQRLYRHMGARVKEVNADYASALREIARAHREAARAASSKQENASMIAKQNDDDDKALRYAPWIDDPDPPDYMSDEAIKAMAKRWGKLFKSKGDDQKD